MDTEAKHEALAGIGDEHGTPCYVYFLDEVRERVKRVRNAFGDRFKISYAVKCNPNPGVLSRLRGVVDRLDVSSGGELGMGVRAGWDASLITFTGPGKRTEELQDAVRYRTGEVVLEGLSEAEELNTIAGDAGVVQEVLVRIAPRVVPKGFGDSMAGKPVAFGIDEEVLEESLDTIARHSNLKLVGFHIYSGTQCLRGDSIVENYRIFIELFERACNYADIEPTKLIFGSGLGIAYHDNQQSLDLEEIGNEIASDLDALKGKARFSKAELILEAGRHLIGEAGVLLTRVIRTKESRGGLIGICDAGMNNQMAAAGHFGMIVKRNYPVDKVWSAHPSSEVQKYQLSGPLCTSIDVVGRGVALDGLQAGDLISIGCSGAYGLTASPMFFISHRLPKEVIVDSQDGPITVDDVSRSLGDYE